MDSRTQAKARPVVEIVGFNCMGIGGSSSLSDESSSSKKICSKLTWKPAVSMLTSEEKHQVVSKERRNYVEDSPLAEHNGKSHLKTQGAQSVLSQLARVRNHDVLYVTLRNTTKLDSIFNCFITPNQTYLTSK